MNPSRCWMRRGALILLAFPLPGLAQFGQNQVVKDDFAWKLRSSEHFDLYYYEGSKARVAEAAETLEKALARLSKALDIPLEPPPWISEKARKRLQWRRRPFFLYASVHDMQQSNIALAGDGTGGITEPFKDRFMVYNDGSRQWLDEVSTHELVHIMQFHILVSGFWRSGRILKTIVYPLWMMEGMAGYLTHDIESALEEITIRDAATSGGLLPLTRLEHFGHLKPHQITLAYKQGAAAMEFLASQFGRRKVGDMLRAFESRLETGQVLSELVGLDAFEFDAKYREHLEAKYGRLARLGRLSEPEAYGGALTRTEDNIPQFNASPVLTPNGKTLVHLTTGKDYPPELRELDLATGRSRALARMPYGPVETLPLGNFANLSRVLALSPDGRVLAFAGTKNHRDSIYLYDRRSSRLERRELPGFMTVSQPQFSPDGRKIVFSGMKGSFTDLYLYDLASRRVERLTDDTRDDQMPVFTPDGRAVIYSAEVLDPSGGHGHERRLYRLELPPGDRSLTRLEDSGGEARDPLPSPDGSRVLFVLEKDGSSEICELELVSRRVRRLTRSKGGMFTPAYAPGGEIIFAALRRGNVHLYKGPRSDFLDEEVAPQPREVPESAKFMLPGMGSLGISTVPAVALGPERPYRFAYSTDLFIPALFYSSVGGLFLTSYWQGSDLLGNHQNSALVSYHSGQSFDYALRYSYQRRRPQLIAGADGFARRDLIAADTSERFNDSVHTQFVGVLYPFDRYHRAEMVLRSASERIQNTSRDRRDDRQARMISYSLVRDTVRGRYLVATKGDRLRLSYTQTAEILGGNRRYYAASAEAHQYLPTGSQSALAFRALGVQSLGRDRPQFILGGVEGVRGYGRSSSQDFGGGLALGRAEWRFPLFPDLNYYMWYFFPDFYFKAIFASVFSDAGYAWNSKGELARTRWRDLRHAVGAGLRLYTFILQEFPLVLSLDYAHRTTQDGGIFYVYLGQVF